MNFRRSRIRSRRNSLKIISSTEKWKKTLNRKLTRQNKEAISDSGDDSKNASDLKNWVEEFFLLKSNHTERSDQDLEVQLTRKQTLILSTLVPDEILLMEKFDVEKPNRFVGVLLMADVSGYTALTEKYNNIGKSGTYKLTATLNTYLGSLIEVIYNHGGDIIKFAGDAFLALWKTDKRHFLSHTIHTVIACALVIQHAYGSFETEVKVNLKVKLAISAGNLIFAPIGTGIGMSYIIIGQPVLEAKKAESICASGEVKLTPTAWGHCYTRNYVHVVHKDGFVTIKAILYDPHDTDVSRPFLGFGAMLRQVNKLVVSQNELSDFLFDPQKKLSSLELSKKNELLNLRKAIQLSEEKIMGSEIRKFMIRPVLTQIDAHQPLEYLTEMRQVSVLFMTLKPKECPLLQLITIVNKSYQITCEIVYKSMGCVNKIILFDKDIMILVIFGLRGFKHESEAQAALKCASNVQKSVAALDGVIEVSIGVTTGQVYCGVVGHPLRREFTVIGAVVNKAARFMCSFRNKITCDETTYLNSKMSSNGFTLQPPTQLKGIVHPGKIYEYSEDIRVKQLFYISIIPPLLNRLDEMEYYIEWINDVNLSFRDFDALLLVGDGRVGKTKLLQWMLRYAKSKNISTCYVNLTSIHSATPYLALSQLIDQILEIKESKEFEKEEKIVQILKYYNEDLCYLNKILKVRFAYHETNVTLSEEEQIEKAKKMFIEIIKLLPETYIIFMDDLQNLDALSWEFISLMLDNMKFFTVLTATRGKFESMQMWFYSVYIKSNIRKIILSPLNTAWIPSLACQILDVVGVSKTLCNSLIKKCKGMPGQVETFILHLFSCGALEFKKITTEERSLYLEELEFPNPTELRPVALDLKEQASLDRSLSENANDEIPICVVIEENELNTDIHEINLDALIMIQLDSLTPYQQLLLKISSVIGNILSRDLLENIMYENDPLITARAIKRLFSMKILTCANVKPELRILKESVISNTSYQTNLICDCHFEYDPDINVDLPKYAFCKVMKFVNKNSRKTFYELLPMNQKKEFHMRIINYLENNKHKCLSCGGSVIVVQSAASLPPNKYKYQSSLLPEKNSISESKVLADTSNYSLQISKSDSSLKIKNPTDMMRNSWIPITPNQKNKSICNILLENNIFVDNFYNNNTKFDHLRPIIEADSIVDWQKIGIFDSQDNLITKKDNVSLSINVEKGVSQTNFKKCSCIEVNMIVYEQLIYHAKEAELKTKMINFLIAFCYLNLLAGNLQNLMPKLVEAEDICQDKCTNGITKFERKIYLGKIYSLKAYSNLLSERYISSKLEIEKAFKIYGINLINVSDFFNIKHVISKVQFKFEKQRNRVIKLKTDSIFSLNVATLLYSTIDDEVSARLATLRALSLTHIRNNNIINLCDTFSNAIHIETGRGMFNSVINIEKIANSTLRKIMRPIQANELFVIGKLFMAFFQARMARGNLILAIQSGYKALIMSEFLCATTITRNIIPDIYYLLISRRRFTEAITILKLLLRTDFCENLFDCQVWYYALCMDLILDAGFQIECPDEIIYFALSAINNKKCIGLGRQRLIVNVWTYWLRIDDLKAKRFENEALASVGQEADDNSLKTLLNSMRLAEGMLESLARKVVDLSKVVDLMELRSLADKELNRLEEDVRNLRTIYPRWMLLKGYSLSLSGQVTAATSFFLQALDEARQNKNRLEQALVLAALSISQTWLKNARDGKFLYWQDAVEHTEKSWHRMLYRITSKR